jgi:CIC family chloride channel protein
MIRRRLRLPSARAYRLMALAALTGVITGLVVALFEQVTQNGLLDTLLEQPIWVQAGAPLVGLALTAMILRWLTAGASPRTSDEYIREFHEPNPRLPLRLLPGKLLAGMTTIGFGGAMGLEGPAVYAGSTIGLSVQQRLDRFITRDEARVLLTAGAAAGVAAVFKTPATGVVFALEAPYKDDVAHRALLPALIAAAASYLTYVSIVGTAPVIPTLGARPSLEITGLAGAVILGLLAGLSGRGFAWLVHRAKAYNETTNLTLRIVIAGTILGGLAVASHALFDEGLTLGPGYDAVDWATEPDHAIGLVALLLVMRVVATITTVGGGGAGGLFIPLAVQGVLLGRVVGDVLDQPDSSLFPVVGLAAFLGAGYRAPIAAVMFVAETSRGDVYVIPALIAAAVSQLVVGRASVSDFQRDTRQGHLERRFALPVVSALKTGVLTVPPDASVAEFVLVHAMGERTREVPVVDGTRYLGICALSDIADLDRSVWDTTTVAEVISDDVPVGQISWTLRDVVAALSGSSYDVLPVVDPDGTFVGIVTEAEIVRLDEILDQTEG